MQKLKNGLINNFRKYFYDPAQRGTSKTDTFSGNGTITEFTLTTENLMYINAVVVNGENKKLNRDYVIDFGTGKIKAIISFFTAPPIGTDNVVITYVYGSNWIYPGTPQTENREMPRAGFLGVNSRHISAGMSETAEYIEFAYRFGIWVKSGDTYTINNKVYTGDKLLDYMYNDISQKLINMRRDYDEPYNVVTIKIGNSVDIPFDETNKFNRKEITIEGTYKKEYS